MHFQLKMGIFRCYVSLPEGTPPGKLTWNLMELEDLVVWEDVFFLFLLGFLGRFHVSSRGSSYFS